MKIIKKIAAMAMIVAVAVTAGWNFYQNTQEMEMNELALANVEALASGETLVLECDSYSVVIICKKNCSSCYKEWRAIGGYGNSGNFRGKCTCGKIY